MQFIVKESVRWSRDVKDSAYLPNLSSANGVIDSLWPALMRDPEPFKVIGESSIVGDLQFEGPTEVLELFVQQVADDGKEPDE